MSNMEWQQRVPLRSHSPKDYLDAAKDPEADDDLLYGLAGQPYDFVHRAVAAHPAATARTLLKALSHGLPREGHEVVRLAVEHRQADEAVYRQAYTMVRRWLEQGDHPYSAVLALASQSTLPAEEVLSLGALPGASSRLRGALQRALSDRG